MEGRVEINYQGRWGSVCGDHWDDVDAAVVCTQLGFSGPSRANVGQYGRGHGITLLSNVRCSDSHLRLADCMHSRWGSTDDECQHGKHAGVVCSNFNTSGEK